MSARDVAYEVVRRTFEEGAYTDRAFPAVADRAGLDPRERRQAMRLAYGTVQRVRTLDHALETLAGRSAVRSSACGCGSRRRPVRWRTRSAAPSGRPWSLTAG